MPEIKQAVKPIEVNYECDACGAGMMSSVGEPDATSGEIEHRCLICNHQQNFLRAYPRIDYIEMDEEI